MLLTAIALASLVTAPKPPPGLDDLPDLAAFSGARAVVDGDWLAFEGGTADARVVVRLAPVPVLPKKPTCGKLPPVEPGWAAVWRFPTPDPVVLHLAEEPTLWAWAKKKRCWVEQPLVLRGSAVGPAAPAVVAHAEPEARLELAALDPALAGYALVDRAGARGVGAALRVIRGDEVVAETLVDEAARLLNATAGETWTRARDPEVEAPPAVKRTLTATLEVYPDGARVIEVRREARWQTDPSAQGGALTGKRLTFWRIDVSDPARPRLVLARNGTFAERSGDGVRDARYVVTRSGSVRVPGGELDVLVAHDESRGGFDVDGSSRASWAHRARVVLRAAGAEVALTPAELGLATAPALAGPTAEIAVDGRKVAVRVGKVATIEDGKPARTLALAPPGTELPAGEARGELGLALRDHDLALHSRTLLRGPLIVDSGTASVEVSAEVLALLPRASAGRPILLYRAATTAPVEER